MDNPNMVLGCTINYIIFYDVQYLEIRHFAQAFGYGTRQHVVIQVPTCQNHYYLHRLCVDVLYKP